MGYGRKYRLARNVSTRSKNPLQLQNNATGEISSSHIVTVSNRLLYMGAVKCATRLNFVSDMLRIHSNV